MAANSNVIAIMEAQQATNEQIYLMLRSLNDNIKNGVSISQSSLQDMMPGRQVAEPQSREDRANKWKVNRDSKKQFSDAFEKGISDALGMSQFKKQLAGSINRFAVDMGVQMEDIPSTLGALTSQYMVQALKKSKLGSQFAANLNSLTSQMTNTVSNALGDISAAGGNLSAGIPALTSGIKAMVPQLAAMGLALAALDVVLDSFALAFAPAIEGIKKFSEAYKKAANRTTETAKAQMELAQERLKADINAMVEEPFKILQDAAEKVEAAWDSALGTITATQGYDKAGLQDLMSAYAQRLRDENLTKYVSGADIIQNLTKVLEAGLSGAVAEEFAYTATKLNAAIPTQDFFSYAATYASIAANAIAAGESQAEAIAYANEELESFASNVLYASREIAGGFSTGLTNASSLLESAVKVANASKVGDASNISGVLTSVAAIVGAVAPDLASSMVDTVVSAALGGNSSQYTALRSLAGTGASNTAFLRSLAQNPQGVFKQMFSSLANLQSMSSDNFMEVAEGLSEVFGVSMDAFARVDFNYLAQAISEMNVHNGALKENMDLLVSGQTTSTAEQLRMEKINQYMIEEGLSYVLDNAVARSIQEHMWQEQMKRDLQETTYGVELVGATQQMLAGILETVKNIINFLNPLSWVKKVTNVLQSNEEGKALSADLRTLLEAGKVGAGNAAALNQLTTRGKNLNLTSDYLSLLGSVKGTNISSSYSTSTLWKNFSEGGVLGAVTKGAYKSPANWLGEKASEYLGYLADGGLAGSVAKSAISGMQQQQEQAAKQSLASYGVTSKYVWSTVGKAKMRDILDSATPGASSPYELLSASSQIAAKSSSRIDSFFKTMDKAIEKNKSYDEWIATAGKYGISDLTAALEERGLTEVELQSAFTAKEAKQASIYQHEREVKEDLFWATGTEFWAVVHPKFQDTMIELSEILNELAEEQLNQLIKSNKQLADFYDQWVDYYVNHTAYTRETLSAYDVAAIRNAERTESGDAVLALANALTSNMVDLKDPAVQTNVILSKILLTAQAIFQQGNQAATVSLPTALSSLGLGLPS